MSNRTSDNMLAEVEDAHRDVGYDYPTAWAMSFLIDNQITLRKALRAANQTELVKTLNSLCKEIRNGSQEK